MRGTALRLGAAMIGLALLTTAAGALEWTGRVVDARTGQPLANVRVHGGHPGRGGLGVVTTGADGTFRVVYPEGYDQNPGQYEWYALVVEPLAVVEEDGWDTSPSVIGERLYINYEARYSRPQGVGDVRLVPRYALVKGKVTNAKNGKAVKGAAVSAFRPGAAIHGTKTDADGVYRLRIDVHQGWGTSVETTAEANRPPESEGWMQPLEQIGVEVSAQGYKKVTISPAGGAGLITMEVPFKSTATADLYTSVDVRLPKKGSGIGLDAGLVTVTAPGEEPSAAAGDAELQAVLADLKDLIEQHRKAVKKARQDGKLPCNQRLLDELRKIRRLLENRGGEAQTRRSSVM